MQQGFSFMEVLISLVIMTSASLALLKQQWQASQYFNKTQNEFFEEQQAQNAYESLSFRLKNA